MSEAITSSRRYFNVVRVPRIEKLGRGRSSAIVEPLKKPQHLSALYIPRYVAT